MSYVQCFRSFPELCTGRLMEFYTRDEEKSRTEQRLYEMPQLGIINEV